MSDDRCTAIIDKLIAQRHSLGMTQSDLAKASCLAQSAIARFEKKKSAPQLDTLIKVAAALGCEVAIVAAANK